MIYVFLYGYTQSLSCAQLFVTPWTVACQATLSMRFPRQEYRSRLPFLTPGIFLTQGSNPHLLGLLHCKKILYYLSHFGCGCAAHPSSLLSLGTSPARFKERGYRPISQLEACQRICDYFLKPPEGVRSCVLQSSWDPYCPSWQLLVTCDCLNIN